MFVLIDKINEAFGTQFPGEDIGYGEMGMNFVAVECEDLDDFHKNTELGQCWIDKNNVTFYKIRNAEGDAEAFYLENGEIVTI